MEATHLSWNNCMKKLFAGHPRATYYETPQYTLLNSGTRMAMLNRVLDTNLTVNEANKTIKDLIDYFGSKQLPFTWQVDPWDQPSDLAERLEEAGFHRDETPGMAVRIDELIEPTRPDNFSYEKVKSLEKLSSYTWLLCRAYQMPEFVWDSLVGGFKNLGLVDYFQHYIGYYDGEPVATSSILYSDGVAGLYNVATMPDVRGKGIGAMISYVPYIDALKRGYRFGILHSTKMGYNVYKRLGFEEICKLIRYQWSPRE